MPFVAKQLIISNYYLFKIIKKQLFSFFTDFADQVRKFQIPKGLAEKCFQSDIQTLNRTAVDTILKKACKVLFLNP